ncbi:MAG: hypothetical protein ACLSAO_06530 [Anaerovoracaceae bacterium]
MNMDMKNQKKVDNLKDILLSWLKDIEEYDIKIQNENNEKKVSKLLKKYDYAKHMVGFTGEKISKAGGNIEDIINSLPPHQQSIMRDIFLLGTDSDTIKYQKKRNEIINRHKDRLNKLKEAYEKYSMYDESLPIEEKLKNKLYKYEKEVGWYLYMQADKDGEVYKPEWNYLEHINESPEFTEEEKKILNRCYKIGEEYDQYRENRINSKVGVIGDFIGDMGYKRFAQGLSNKLFPKYIWMIYPNQNFSDIELKQLGKIMAAKYITFAADKEELKNILRRRLKIINEIRRTNKENEIIDIYAKTTEDEDTQLFAILKEEFSAEDALFVHLYTDDPYIAEILDGLNEYSFKELGLE